MSDTTDETRVGRVLVAPELLLGLFDLPPGHTLVAVHAANPRAVEFYIGGPLMPVCEVGALAPEVRLTFRRKDYELVAVNDESVQPTGAARA